MENFSHADPLQSLREALQQNLAEVENPKRPCRPVGLLLPEGSASLGRFHGSIGSAELEDFKGALAELNGENILKVFLDLADVSLSRSAVGELTAFAADIHCGNRRLYLFRPTEKIRAVLDELNISRFFSLLEDEDDVIAGLAV